MRVVDPRYIRQARSRRELLRRRLLWRRRVFIGLLIIIIGVLLWRGLLANHSGGSASVTRVSSKAAKSHSLKDLTPEQMKQVINDFNFPNTSPQKSAPDITGNADADDVIRRIAEQRGYRLRPIANGVVKFGDKSLQATAVQPLKDLQAAAEEAGQHLTLVSGYRSLDDQRQIFEQQMGVQAISADDIASGDVDNRVDQILQYFSAPGYSRHHTGFTIDLGCNGGQLENFEASSCYSWISQNNYAIARGLGWLPSYPKGAKQQGPEPEPWEFVWVGTNVLMN